VAVEVTDSLSKLGPGANFRTITLVLVLSSVFEGSIASSQQLPHLDFSAAARNKPGGS
jgi:hypothetical protein